jgi:HD-GYP domain-containing protein (c-di-GMP phosphodiesterase class II)
LNPRPHVGRDGSDRPYRPSVAVEEALRELRQCAGTQFDPAVVEAFVEVLADRHRRRGKDESAPAAGDVTFIANVRDVSEWLAAAPSPAVPARHPAA